MVFTQAPVLTLGTYDLLISYLMLLTNFLINCIFRTFHYGFGAPPAEITSTFVVIVTTVGFVLPLFSLLSGGFIVLVRRLRT